MPGRGCGFSLATSVRHASKSLLSPESVNVAPSPPTGRAVILTLSAILFELLNVLMGCRCCDAWLHPPLGAGLVPGMCCWLRGVAATVSTSPLHHPSSR